MLRFVPDLARSVGLGPLPFSPHRRFVHRAVHRLPTPVDPFGFVVGFQPQLPQLLEHARRAPLREASMGATAGADARGIQSIPLATRAQHEEDAIHGAPIRHPWAMTAQRMGLAGGRRQQGLDLGPQFV